MKSIIMSFARKVAPIFAAFGWIIPLSQTSAGAHLSSSHGRNKNRHTYRKADNSDKAKSRLYSRRLTRSNENYSLD